MRDQVQMARNVKWTSFVVMVLSRAPHATGEMSTASQVCLSQPSCFQLNRQSTPQFLLHTKNGEECEMRLLRGYGTRPRAAGKRRNTYR